MRGAFQPISPFRFDHPNNILPSTRVPHYAIFSSLLLHLFSQAQVRSLLSKTLNLCPSLNVTGNISGPYKTMRKMIPIRPASTSFHIILL
jgi:hypothetical protein